MIEFVVWSPHYQQMSGGVLALHKLAHNLNLLGEKAYLVSDTKNSSWLGELITPTTFDLTDKRYVVIYPEIIVGNLLGATNVVRWLLNAPGVVGGDGIYGDNDLIFTYWDFFQGVIPPERISGCLRAFDTMLDFWVDENLPRQGTCYLIRKGRNKTQAFDPSWTKVDAFSNEMLKYIFNRKEVFISFDHASFISVQAALCGCLSVVVPDGVNNAEQWRGKLPVEKYGIAYGNSPEEIQRAIETRKFVRSYMQELEAESIYLTKEFIKIVKEKFE